MASINNEILAAVEVMQKRAAEFDDKFDMDGVEGRADYNYLLRRAARNLNCALSTINGNPEKPLHMTDEDRYKCLADTMNLCALAMSIIPTLERGAYGQNGDSLSHSL